MLYQILPSILSADLMNLGKEIEAVIDAGADQLHFDVMDNHYVPNLTFGPLLCEQIHQKFPNIPIDVHIMASPVDSLIKEFAEAGASRISIHPEATNHLDRSLQLIKDLGCQAGLVLNPATSTDSMKWTINNLDFVLVMTVNPGFAGQQLIPEVTKKIEEIHTIYPKLPITVDGGINSENISKLAASGATQFIAGSAIFKSQDYKKTINKMRNQLD